KTEDTTEHGRMLSASADVVKDESATTSSRCRARSRTGSRASRRGSLARVACVERGGHRGGLVDEALREHRLTVEVPERAHAGRIADRVFAVAERQRIVGAEARQPFARVAHALRPRTQRTRGVTARAVDV